MKKAFVNSVDSIIVELLFFFPFFHRIGSRKGLITVDAKVALLQFMCPNLVLKTLGTMLMCCRIVCRSYDFPCTLRFVRSTNIFRSNAIPFLTLLHC